MYFTLEKQKFVLLQKVSRQRGSIQGYLFNPACDVQSPQSQRFPLSHPHFTYNYCHPSTPPTPHISSCIPPPSQHALEIHRGIDRKTSPVSLWMLGGMYITDQWFRCLLSPTDSNTMLVLVRVQACISKSDVYEPENLPHFSPRLSFRWASWKIRHLSVAIHICLRTHQHVN